MSFSPNRRSARPSTPNWRSSSTLKKQQPATSLSLVVAQPEQGSPLRSAVDHLPVIKLGDSDSVSSIMSKKRERFQSTSTVARGSDLEAEEANRKRSKVGSVVSQQHEVVISLPSDESIQAEETEQPQYNSPVTESLRTSSGLTLSGDPTPTQSVPFPISEPHKVSNQIKPSPSRLSWFGSLSRTKGRDQSFQTEDSSQVMPAGEISVSSEPRAIVHHQCFNQESQPSNVNNEMDGKLILKSDIGPQQLQSGSMQASTQSRQVISAANSTDLPSTSLSGPSQIREGMSPVGSSSIVVSPSVSSVDEEVPRPRLVSSNSPAMPSGPAVLHSQDDRAIGKKPSITSLNPSTSRFSLRLPLLGRSKVPLQEVVHVGEVTDRGKAVESGHVQDSEQSDDVQSVHPSPSICSPSTDALKNLTTAPIPIESSELSSGSSPSDQSRTSPTQDGSVCEDDKTPKADPRVASASSWWDYVGWSSSSKTNHATAINDAIEPSKLQTPTSHSTPKHLKDVKSLPQTSEITDTIVQQEPPHLQQVQEQTVQENSSKPNQKPSSIFSAETAKSQNSAWYSPWAWYYSSSKLTSNDTPKSEASSAEPAEISSEATKTESEMVKEQALARDDSTPIPTTPAPAPAPEIAPVSSASVSPLDKESKNPIESSISTSRSSWVSFFTTRGLLTKNVANDNKERDETGMEVMTIEEDQDEDKLSNSGSTPVAVPDGKRSVQQSLPQISPSQRSPLPPSKQEYKKFVGSLSITDSRKAETTKQAIARSPSPAPSKVSAASPRPSPPNLILPTWEQTFRSPPRSNILPKPQSAKSKLSKTFSLVSEALFSKDEPGQGKEKGKERETEREARFIHFGKELPKALDVVGEQLNPYILNGGCRVVIIGVAGWSPGPVTRTLAGGFPSSSNKFVDMTCQALELFEHEHGFKFKKITRIPLDGDGTIERKVSKVHSQLIGNEDWMEDLHAADVVFVASHSQGCIISTHLVDRLIRDGHILTSRSVDILRKTAATIAPGGAPIPASQAQKICFLALCGIHLGPLRYLKTSSLLQPYIQYFENAAARELFEFQNTESQLSKDYAKALQNILDHGAKVVYVASLNDQVVPIYSGLFTAASHPRILRALYIDGDAYHSSDFLSNLLVLLIRIMNSGLSEGGLLNHLSEATAGTLSGVGHSSAYEEPATFSLAVKYFFLTTDGDNERKEFVVEPFNAVNEQNDYEIPWSLRDMIADERVAHYFAQEFSQLRDAFDDWQPKTSILRDVKKKLQPIQRLTSFTYSGPASRL
ncbi:hypothetical protein AcV7_009996 [Taiwanofungus camphoratus]|nr:hypothetical protein AcV7_009996 [Antrodia cinnamomea]